MLTYDCSDAQGNESDICGGVWTLCLDDNWQNYHNLARWDNEKIFSKGQSHLNRDTHACPDALTSVWRNIVCQRRSRQNHAIWGIHISDDNPLAHSRLSTCAARLGKVYICFSSLHILLPLRFHLHGHHLRVRPSAIHSSACRAPPARANPQTVCLVS